MSRQNIRDQKEDIIVETNVFKAGKGLKDAVK